MFLLFNNMQYLCLCTGGGSSAVTLQAADVKAISVAQCKQYWSNTGETHICVWEEGSKGACNVSSTLFID